MAVSGDERALTTEEMLAEEANAIHGDGSISLPGVLQGEEGQREQKYRVRINADERSGAEVDASTVEARKQLYRSLNALNRAALCLSGGGIRSATFCLGVIQALAGYDVAADRPARQSDQAQSEGEDLIEQGRQAVVAVSLDETSNAIELVEVVEMETKPTQDVVQPANSLLGRFHYLSTVSGGGYVGSWLSSWRTRDDFATVVRNLTGRPSGPDVEPPEISWLRAYSNYLTPKIGIASADTWAAVAIVVRNLVLNWLVIIPVLCVALLLLKIIVALSVPAALGDSLPLALVIILFGILFLIAAQAFTTRHRPARQRAAAKGKGQASAPVMAAHASRHSQTAAEQGRTTGGAQATCLLCGRTDLVEKCCVYRQSRPEKKRVVWRRTNVDDICLVARDLIWAALSAIAVTIFFASAVGVGWVAEIGRRDAMLLTAAASIGIYALGWIAGFRWTSWSDFLFWALSGAVYGGLVGLGAGLYTLLPYPPTPDTLWSLLLPISFGVPWVLMAQLTADNVFGGWVSYEAYSDSDREWLGRAAGWLAAFAIAWAIVAFLVFAAGYYVGQIGAGAQELIAAAGGVSGIIAAFLGKSSKTPAGASSSDQLDWTAIALNVALAVVGPIFCAALIVGLSIGLDQLLLGDSLINLLLDKQPPTILNSPTLFNLAWLVGGAFIAYLIASVASHYVNINRFSLHALYRNRLSRAYLGASRQDRHPDAFTGLDPDDNIRMHELWPPHAGGGVKSNNLFHVVNIALNIVSTKRLAWQERKAEAFTASPKHCGSAYLGFRRSEDYGDSFTTTTPQRGIALGTAMAVSGAAVSSNMGYHSSTSLSLLLTLFNVRLGWWLGNPGEAGNKEQAFRREGPRLAAKPLFYEAFGQTTDTSAYVYLSDGGHFENLGLYEMVRRRCRLILVVDAGSDPKFAFDDLGNAVRKIYIDLGIRITFEQLDKLRDRPAREDGPPDKIPYCAIGTIEYGNASADGIDCANGKIIYLKPAYHGTEGAGIQAYAKANKDFPHETTADQWFTESQFESYRSLGLDIANDVLQQKEVREVFQGFLNP